MKESETPISAINQSLNKFSQGIKDESKIQRKNAIESMRKQLAESFKVNSSPTAIKFPFETVKTVLKSILNALNDPMEKCRELSCEIIKLVLEYSNTNTDFWDNDLTSMLIMTLNQRLGGKEVKETSEEIRLELISLLYLLMESKSGQKHIFEAHFQELVSILINSINDLYPDAKKKGCLCTKLLANKLAGSSFHMQSEQLVKPLLQNIVHQHSRVRKDIIECLCDVIQYGNNKSVTDAISHLAQRLFDQAPQVRMAVIKLVGTWLLDLPDRYSFWSKLIPLLLTGFIDEALEVKELTESLWWDVGIKYEKENDEELKDKASFLESDLSNYPADYKDNRPNLGCRELIRQNASKILPGILNDVGDWVEATRIKSIQLLLIMIWQAENNTTQHLETILQTLFKASNENLDMIQNEIARCSKLAGHFTDPSVTLRFAIRTIKKMASPNHGSINILNGLLMGHGNRTPFEVRIETLNFINEICLTLDASLQVKLMECCKTLSSLSKDSVEANQLNQFEYLMFKATFTLSALSNDDKLKESGHSLIQSLNTTSVAKVHLVALINELKANCDSWNDNSLEPIIFAKLVSDFGLSEDINEPVMFILKQSLNPARDVQLRTRFLLLIPTVYGSSQTNSAKFLENSLEDIINDMILPNIQWKAGRAASAVRMTSIASLALIMQTDTIKNVKIKQETLDSFLKMMLATLDDDNKSTRLYVSKIFYILLSSYGKRYDKDQLHKLYPELVKRLDDQSEEIRAEILNVFYVYVDCLLNGGYDKVLYQAHLQFVYENLLLYLDDSDFNIQTKVFNFLSHASKLGPEILAEEIKKVKSKHRNTKLCDDLMGICQSLNAN